MSGVSYSITAEQLRRMFEQRGIDHSLDELGAPPAWNLRSYVRWLAKTWSRRFRQKQALLQALIQYMRDELAKQPKQPFGHPGGPRDHQRLFAVNGKRKAMNDYLFTGAVWALLDAYLGGQMIEPGATAPLWIRGRGPVGGHTTEQDIVESDSAERAIKEVTPHQHFPPGEVNARDFDQLLAQIEGFGSCRIESGEFLKFLYLPALATVKEALGQTSQELGPDSLEAIADSLGNGKPDPSAVRQLVRKRLRPSIHATNWGWYLWTYFQRGSIGLARLRQKDVNVRPPRGEGLSPDGNLVEVFGTESQKEEWVRQFRAPDPADVEREIDRITEAIGGARR